ncbi:hypothetical protein M440DRAFT_1446517 [Trichoderma longibrachiatum ATCC 18648]|uniref:Amino acid transporter n=1 Tax=Trichoderma longibrachiatum ATCC 18648 TaxID=983965 RepID=A0A2T4BX75_TRILO|nr:hypothetical protein M440DRAFT_1446517 [Trichoderma longibrachiatum ATCC 18648]
MASKKAPNITKLIDNHDDLDTVDQATRDAVDLAALGHSQALSRKFDVWSMLALAFCVLGTYSTEAQGLSSGLTNGGPVAVLWGLAVVTLCNVCVAVSMGELCSSMPTALGQAFWISQLSPTAPGRFTAYMCAWINTFGWWTLTASQNAFMTEFLLGMKVMFDPDWDGAGKGWVQFLVYVGITVFFTAINHVGCRNDRFLLLLAILSVSTIALTVSYAMPIIVLLIVGRDKLPPGEFRLGRLGMPLNIISIVYCAITTVFFLFPGVPNPAPSDMNYAIAVFGVMLVAAVGFWFVKGRVSFMQMDELEGQVVRELSYDIPNPQTATAGDMK